MKIIYSIENLDCAHCAAEIEREIRKIKEIESAELSFATKLLHIVCTGEEGILERIQNAADSVEEGVIFKKYEMTTDHERGEKHHKNEILVLIAGIALFVFALFFKFLLKLPYLSLALLAIAYVIMGWEVFAGSFKSIRKGQLFDEKFLMCIATLGAVLLNCWEEAVGVMLFFRIGELFEHIAVDRSRKTIMKAIDFRPDTVQILKDGEVHTVPAEEVSIGDVMLVRAGDRIPIDGVILEGTSTVDTSAMTGESIPIEVGVRDAVMSGCINLSGVLEVSATATLKDSMVTRILESVENAAAGKPMIDRFITRFSQIYTPSVVTAAILTAIIPSIITGDTGRWIYTALNFLMISCPCALVLSVPLTYFCGIGMASRRGILFKDGISLEILAKIKVVIMDKTGTLTDGKLSVSAVHSENLEEKKLIEICASLESSSAHPIACSLVDYAKTNQIPISEASSVTEIAGKGITGDYLGKQILCGTKTFLVENGIEVPSVLHQGTVVYIARNGSYLGYIELSDTPKPSAAQAVQKLKSTGLHTVMLTGDSLEHAERIASELQIDEIHAQLLPDEKLEYLKQIRAKRGRVLFVGDGINDSPVLSGADVGAAMGSGADAAMEAADILFLNSDPEAIPESIRIAKRVDHTTKIVIVFAIAIKLLVMILGFLGFASMWLSVFADTGVTILCVIYILYRIYFYKEQL